MSNKYDYPQIERSGSVDNDSARYLFRTATDISEGWHIFVETIHISVYEAAIGGGGILEIRDIEGGDVFLYKMNVDGVKDITLNFGDAGIRTGTNGMGEIILHGAETKQASASIHWTGHKSFQTR